MSWKKSNDKIFAPFLGGEGRKQTDGSITFPIAKEADDFKLNFVSI
ncbi:MULTISPECIES: hypothetical protein [Streptococcus]|nr:MULTISPECIES: hypothetical protein [Streptococcus]